MKLRDQQTFARDLVAAFDQRTISALVYPFDVLPRDSVWVAFGEPDEGQYPYQLHLDDAGCTVSDRQGDPLGMISGHVIAEVAALCVEIIGMGQYLDENGESLEGRCGTCNRNVDNYDPAHRVTSVLRGGKGVQCLERGEIIGGDAAPLARIGYPK